LHRLAAGNILTWIYTGAYIFGYIADLSQRLLSSWLHAGDHATGDGSDFTGTECLISLQTLGSDDLLDMTLGHLLGSCLHGF